MFNRIINYSLNHKLIIILFTITWVGFGIFALTQISIGAVPDITNNQVQVITTSRNLATEDVEKFLTYPVELEMANLPGVKEIRSISKFGLSVVTIVFEDNLGTYLPRQLIAEKIKSAEEKIPSGFGLPFMGPVSTGLGEIYQYILDIKPGYKDRYSVTDLRTIQDWIVKRQLSGIPGVVEVNTWGGFLKTYEVSIDPDRLKSMNISLGTVYKALESNNSIAGGGYIEKANESYFIRADGLLNSIDDIKKIVVENRNGTPIFIKDLAEVGFGHATRFGAITGNGEGEKVLGQVMMLKDASSKEVINAVKERVEEIQKTLPEGIFINGFLERSALIGRTTFTISENLILGSLIVIFIVILLLGNFRSGLVVASVIPLSLLFAILLMYIFGIDANLMSLGAIDFGIIIDGAVIIIEYITYSLARKSEIFPTLSKEEKFKLKDKISLESTKKMMHSAIFGQIIIIIVFIPILSLAGVEGKMFRPMALTFSFALTGAMILCFTYLPVMASLFIKPTKPNNKHFSNRLIHFLQSLYKPTITLALKLKATVISIAAILLIVALYFFNRMGGEFVPTLDEGDFVIQPVFKTGMSLSSTIEMTTRIEAILRKFPEVDQVITRIGAAEVPTDPMSMEESDVIITLKPIKEWTSAETKDELAEIFRNAVFEEIQGIEIEFTQPIEMRFNELITGVRADLAIKVFGEDLEILAQKANEIKKAIENVEGAADIVVEKTEGLPQMTVKFDRNMISKYGVNIADLNDVIAMGFAGKVAGSIFEGEKQFDLVIKYRKEDRKDLEDLKNAMVEIHNGMQMPLSAFAKIEYTSGPAKISRDDTRRRVVVGVNVRGRDLQSVVDDIQTIIGEKIKFPVGYSVKYGGQFENLQSASKRLMIAVPISLILIFILLYFAFDSVRDALIIFSAIPLASVGGVFLLYFRGLPFSISAGVGFIALFGIAVLNGIVLIEHFKELKSKGVEDVHERVIRGTTERLRPVLLTATAAALGFLPMAISTSAGAEVQRPLATVVIGGLVTATLLTLIVLPVLYSVFEKRIKVALNPAVMILFVLIPVFSIGLNGQKIISVEEAVEIGLNNNLRLKSSMLEIDKSKALIGSTETFGKADIYYEYDRANIAGNGIPLQVFGIKQSFKLPSFVKANDKLLASNSESTAGYVEIEKWMLSKEIRKTYFEIVYWKKIINEYNFLDSLYQSFENASNKKYELGEGSLLEKLTANAKRQEITLQLEQAKKNELSEMAKLKYWMQSGEVFSIQPIQYDKITVEPPNIRRHPAVEFKRLLVNNANFALDLSEKQILPDVHLSFFNSFSGIENFNYYPGIQAGVSIPLWKKSLKSLNEAAKIEVSIKSNDFENQINELENKLLELQASLAIYEEAINKYINSGSMLQDDLIAVALKSLNGGEIDFFQYIFTLESAVNIRINYLKNLHSYNQIVIDINHLIN